LPEERARHPPLPTALAHRVKAAFGAVSVEQDGGPPSARWGRPKPCRQATYTDAAVTRRPPTVADAVIEAVTNTTKVYLADIN